MRHVVAPDRGNTRRFEPGWARPDHGDRSAMACRCVPIGILGLAAARRFADARHDRVTGIAHLTGLVAPGARTDPVGLVVGTACGRGRGRRSAPWSSRRRRTALDRRSRRAPTPPARNRRSSPGGSRGRHGGVNRSAHVDVESGRLVEVGSGLLGREDRAAGDDEVVDAAGHELRWRSPAPSRG